MKMINDVVMLLPDDYKEDGAIFIPKQARETSQTGVVMLTGPGRWTDRDTWVPMTVQPGDRVVFNPERTTDIVVDGTVFQCIHAEHILGVVE